VSKSHASDSVVLETPTIPVSGIDDSVLKLVEDLRDTMWSYDICVGLAAPQVGERLRVAVVNPKRESRDEDLPLINPVLISTWGAKDSKRESCMSLWGLQGEVVRRSKVKVRFTNILGEEEERVFEGFIGRVIQHEVDHLDGILYVRRLESASDLEPSAVFDGQPEPA